MRHGKTGRKFERFSSWRKATLRDIAKGLLIHQQIRTTKMRAKEVRKLAEHLISLGKAGSLAARRAAYAILCDHVLVKKLFDKIAPRFMSRNGGYTRIIPLGLRRGDNAEMVILELTEKEIIAVKPKKEKAAKKAKETPAAEESGTPLSVADEDKKAAPLPKPTVKREILQEKGKSAPGKGMIGGLQKMFRRKVGGE